MNKNKIGQNRCVGRGNKYKIFNPIHKLLSPISIHICESMKTWCLWIGSSVCRGISQPWVQIWREGKFRNTSAISSPEILFVYHLKRSKHLFLLLSMIFLYLFMSIHALIKLLRVCCMSSSGSNTEDRTNGHEMVPTPGAPLDVVKEAAIEINSWQHLGGLCIK